MDKGWPVNSEGETVSEAQTETEAAAVQSVLPFPSTGVPGTSGTYLNLQRRAKV